MVSCSRANIDELIDAHSVKTFYCKFHISMAMWMLIFATMSCTISTHWEVITACFTYIGVPPIQDIRLAIQYSSITESHDALHAFWMHMFVVWWRLDTSNPLIMITFARQFRAAVAAVPIKFSWCIPVWFITRMCGTCRNVKHRATVLSLLTIRSLLVIMIIFLFFFSHMFKCVGENGIVMCIT